MYKKMMRLNLKVRNLMAGKKLTLKSKSML